MKYEPLRSRGKGIKLDFHFLMDLPGDYVRNADFLMEVNPTPSASSKRTAEAACGFPLVTRQLSKQTLRREKKEKTVTTGNSLVTRQDASRFELIKATITEKQFEKKFHYQEGKREIGSSCWLCYRFD